MEFKISTNCVIYYNDKELNEAVEYIYNRIMKDNDLKEKKDILNEISTKLILSAIGLIGNDFERWVKIIIRDSISRFLILKEVKANSSISLYDLIQRQIVENKIKDIIK